MKYKILLILIGGLLFSLNAYAQVNISGTVTDARTGETIPGVNVIISELQIGASTNIDGEYTITNVPSGTYTLTVSYVGYRRFSSEIEVGTSNITRNISLEEDILGLEEIVVTGVGRGTETTKLGFSVAKISERQLQEVPASNLGSAIRGKAPGITIVKASGDPAAPASIRLRGTTSLTGDSSPLIIVDGIITDGNLADINMQDVQSIEVVKGAAAASLYGSLAGNGVIQILTKRSSDAIDRPRVTFRSEYGFNQLARDYPLTRKHPWRMDGEFAPVFDSNGYLESWPGFETLADPDNTVYDQDYPLIYDNVGNVFTSQPYRTNYVQVSSSALGFNYLASYERHDEAGVLEPLSNFERNSVRFNADYTQGDRFRLQFSGNYINRTNPIFPEQGQGANYFYSTISALPFLDFTEIDPNTNDFSNRPSGYGIAGSNIQNPLYVARNFIREDETDRYLLGLLVSYDLTDWLSAFGRQSLDIRNDVRRQHTPVGYQTPIPSTTLNNGFEYLRKDNVSTAVTELWLESVNSFGDFNFATVLKYLQENRKFDRFEASGFNYSVPGLRRLGATSQDTYSIDSIVQDEIVQNIILNTDVDYKDKIIVGAMIRQDGSSLFGEDERYQIYYRGSLAYRLTQDIDINNVQELKLRASYGVSGQRPPWQAQYETFIAGATSVTPGVLGNTAIRPSTIAEAEFGIDLTFLNRFNFTANYAATNVSDDYWNVPLPGTAAFSSQWQNIGKIENRTIEFLLGGQAISQRDLTLDFNLTFDRTTQTVTDLGPLPPFRRSVGSAIELFRFEEGVSYGAMYGAKALTSIDQLTLNADGNVVNPVFGSSTSHTPADFMVNDMGYVVLAAHRGTANERPMYLVDETGDKQIVMIGDTQPDFKMGLSSNLNWKGLNVYMLWDWVQGNDVYNYSRQLLYDREVHLDLETYTKAGYHRDYIQGGTAGLYNGAQATSHFVEDATFLKLRELAVSYTLNNRQLGPLGEAFRDIRFSAIGRNLLTFTSYSGWDPEVALRTNSTNFRIDEYAYPNFRTYSFSVQFRI